MIYLTKQIKEPKFINEDLAWLLGVMCGDGCLEKYRKCHYRISLSTINKNFGKTFVEKINKIFQLNEKFNSKIFTNNNSRYYKVQIEGKHLYNFFKKFGTFGCFEWKVPEQILNSDIKIKQSFLRGYYDSEGYFNICRKVYKRIRVVSVNKNGLRGISELLTINGIKVNLIKEKNCYSLSIYKNIGFSFKNIG